MSAPAQVRPRVFSGIQLSGEVRPVGLGSGASAP
jgi:hypothetical protein